MYHFITLLIFITMIGNPKTVFDYTIKDLAGKETTLAEHKGKVIMIVNTASECGLTPQLGGLEKLYQKYKSRGFVIIGFPSNEFLYQEPLNGQEIAKFCSKNYGVTFPIMGKTTVKGGDQTPLYQYLTKKEQNGTIDQEPTWNFHKYMVDKNGHVVAEFSPKTEPESKDITEKIEEMLGK